MKERRPANAIFTILPILSVGVFLLGAAYHQGYLGAYGINDSFFQLSTERAIFIAFTAFVSKGLVPFLYIFLAAVAIYMSLLVALVSFSNARFRRLRVCVRRKLRKKRTAKTSAIVDSFLEKSGPPFFYIYGAVIVITLFVLACYASAISGKTWAASEKKMFVSGKGNYVKLYSTEFSEPKRAIQIECSASHCAFWIDKEAVILPHSAIKRIVAYKAPKEVKQETREEEQ